MRARVALWPLTCALVVFACAKRPQAVAPPVREPSPCPPGVLWLAGIPDPPEIRIENQREEPVTVFIDECTAHRRVGDVPAQSVQVFTLPQNLAVYSAGLRFHPYRAEGPEDARELPVAHVPLDTARVLRLVVPAGEVEPCPRLVYVNGERYSGSLGQIPADRIVSIAYHFPDGSGTGPEARCPSIHVRTREQEE